MDIVHKWDTAQSIQCCPVQVDPDAEALEAERANKRSSAAGLLCSGPPAAAGASPLDF